LRQLLEQKRWKREIGCWRDLFVISLCLKRSNINEKIVGAEKLLIGAGGTKVDRQFLRMGKLWRAGAFSLASASIEISRIVKF
jgi:hypothetical protein